MSVIQRVYADHIGAIQLRYSSCRRDLRDEVIQRVTSKEHRCRRVYTLCWLVIHEYHWSASITVTTLSKRARYLTWMSVLHMYRQQPNPHLHFSKFSFKIPHNWGRISNARSFHDLWIWVSEHAGSTNGNLKCVPNTVSSQCRHPVPTFPRQHWTCNEITNCLLKLSILAPL